MPKLLVVLLAACAMIWLACAGLPMLNRAEGNGQAVAIGIPLAVLIYFVGTRETRPRR